MGRRTLIRIEIRSIDYVPLAERHGKVWHLWPVWFSGSAHLATLAVGILGITLGGNLIWTMIAVVAGCLLGTFFMAFHSTQGPQLGLPQMIQSRPQFGYTGALLVWAVAMVAYIGYNAFNQVLAAQALHQLTGAISATSPAAIIVFALLAVSLALIGYDKIHLAQRGFAYLMIAILTAFSVGALIVLRFPAAQWRLADFRTVPFLAQLFAAASYQLSWSIYVSDYSRYLPRDVGVRASFWWTYLGAFVGGAWMMLVGTLAAATAPQLDVAAAMEHAANRVLPGLGKVLLVGGLLGLVTITALNFYGASLTLLSVADTLKPLRCTVGKRVASLAAALIVSTAIALNSSRQLRRRLQRPAGGAAVPVHAVDCHQPGGLLHRAPRPLFDPRDLQCPRHVRSLELAWAYGLRHRVRRDDSVLQHRALPGPGGARARRRRHRHAGGTAGVGAGLPPRLPLVRSRA